MSRSGLTRFELGLPPQAAGAHARSVRQIFNAAEFSRAQHVARILTLGDGSDFEFRRNLGRQVFQAVHSQIDAFFRQRFFDFLGEHAFGSDFGQSNIGDLVAGGVDDFDFDFHAAFAEKRGDVIGLPERELRSAGANAEPGH